MVTPDRLVLFARPATPGRVKTRLIPAVGADRAARLHAVFVEDLVARLGALREVRLTLYHPGPGDPWLRSLGVPLVEQAGLDLGERMCHAFETELRGGAERVVLIGSDSPDLPIARIEAAFALLRKRSCVIGPAFDGGYHLIGLRRVLPELFRAIPWGTGGVLGSTLERLRRASIDTGLLAPWYDVDRPEDLRFLHDHLRLLRHARGENRCPRTLRLLEEPHGKEP